jgi:pimeloyl-ACP methyl ester carboxylesterase
MSGRLRAFVLWMALSGALAAPQALAAAPPEAPGRWIDVGDARLYVEVMGSGPPILFLHGGLRYFDTTFARQAPFFSAFRTVIGVDQRGHGHSPDNAQAFSYDQMAEDTASVLGQLHLGPVDVVGHSDGGNVGLLLALRHPELVRRLVVSGANLRGGHPRVLGFLRSLVTTDTPPPPDAPSPLRDEYAKVSPEGGQHWPVVLAKSNALWATRSVLSPEDLHTIQLPVLVMAGDRDDISLDQTTEIFHDLPQAQLCILPGSGHETMIDRADDFNRLARAFVEVRTVP